MENRPLINMSIGRTTYCEKCGQENYPRNVCEETYCGSKIFEFDISKSFINSGGSK